MRSFTPPNVRRFDFVPFSAAIRVLVPALLLGAAAAPAIAQNTPEQTEHRAGFEPVSDEIFRIVEHFYDLDAGNPLAARTLDSWETDEAVFENVVFTTQSGERVPGDLALPLAGDGPYPVVILVHGLGSNRDRWWQEDRTALPDRLLAAGVAVFTLDLAFHGARAAQNDYQNPVFLTMGDSLFVKSRDMVIQSTIDVRRAMAYLETRSEIDRKRIAVAGYSMGAGIAFRVAALEKNLAAVVASAATSGNAPVPTDYFNFAARTRAPVLLQIGRNDWLSSPEDAETLRDLIPAGDKELRFYESGHRLPPEFAEEAAAWLLEKLRR